MAAIVSYATLTSEIARVSLRTYDAAVTDGYIGNAEADARIHLGPHFAKETSATLPLVAGVATLPTGLVRVLSLSHATYGPLTETSLETIRALRINGGTTAPAFYAITGTSILTDALYTGNLTLDYEGTLTGLSSGNPTNWLVTYAPQAYLLLCLSYAKVDEEDFTTAAGLKAAALSILDDLGIQSMVTQKSRASVTIPGATP